MRRSVILVGIFVSMQFGFGAEPRAATCAQHELQPVARARRLAVLRGAEKPTPLRIEGVVTVVPGTLTDEPATFYVQDESGGIAVQSGELPVLPLGARVSVCGVPELYDGVEPELTAFHVVLRGRSRPVAARAVSIRELEEGMWSGVLVKISGVVRRTAVGEVRDSIYLRSDADDFRAYVRRASSAASNVNKLALPGATVEVIGVPVPFGNDGQQLRLRTTHDLALLQAPAQFSRAQVIAGTAIVVALSAVVTLWVWALRRAIARQTAEIKKLLAEAQEASRLKSQFLANMSHEIRTPLNGILGMQTMLLDTRLNSEQHSWLKEAQSCTVSLLNLLNDILDLSKAEADRLQLLKEPFDIRKTVEDAAGTVRLQCRDKRLDLLVRIDGAVPERVTGDSFRLRQVLLNLLSNAVKFTSAGSITVRVEVEQAQVSPWPIRFSVRDTGIGISAEHQELIFDSFRQADGSISRTYGGTGLGLAISRQIVELMGGCLAVESTENEGSEFWFVAHFEPAPDVPSTLTRLPPDPPAPLARAQSARILVVEDNRVNRLIAQQLLTRAGYRIETAESGLEAIDRVRQGAFDVVLMDVQMPGMSGLEATRELRRLEEESGSPRLRILALTALATAEDSETCRLAGMDGFVSKPWKLDTLVAAIESESVADSQDCQPTIIDN